MNYETPYHFKIKKELFATNLIKIVHWENEIVVVTTINLATLAIIIFVTIVL